ncbi:M15 family metallopeptidase [Paenibacillus sp. MBLB4367]|uniref:M15 family metallopeptidase n=1 Tax=Paenibacillus sp. MBLB4367 TaxID=3384767 RepID=UPI0039081D9C
MKKWFFVIAVLLLAIYEVYQQRTEVAGEKPNIAVQEAAQAVIAQDNRRTIKITKDQVYRGDLLLVNKEYPVREEGVKSDVVRLYSHKELLQGFGLLDTSIRLSQSVAQTFLEMIRAADKDGVNHFMISSGYRDSKEQSELYKEMGDARALPANHSEHNLGLSLDIGSTSAEMNQAPEGKWLQNNAWKYGFILRYPKDKSDITGIQYEPWHFRYVGLPHSAIMQEKKLTLEEYLELLKEQKNLSTTINGQSYEISYQTAANSKTVTVPAGRRYTISGDNRDGVIVTVYP